MTKSTDALRVKLREIGHIQGITSLLHWDQATYMPHGATKARGEQFAYMNGLLHEKYNSPEFKHILSELVDLKTGELVPELNDDEAALVGETYKDYKKRINFTTGLF